MDGLNERKEKILRAVVVEYIVAAEPVASDLLANKYELGVRSATIRNEMIDRIVVHGYFFSQLKLLDRLKDQPLAGPVVCH